MFIYLKYHPTDNNTHLSDYTIARVYPRQIKTSKHVDLYRNIVSPRTVTVHEIAITEDLKFINNVKMSVPHKMKFMRLSIVEYEALMSRRDDMRTLHPPMDSTDEDYPNSWGMLSWYRKLDKMHISDALKNHKIRIMLHEKGMHDYAGPVSRNTLNIKDIIKLYKEGRLDDNGEMYPFPFDLKEENEDK